MARLAEKKRLEEDEEMGVIDKLFSKDINPSFAEDLQLAFRAASFIIICSLPFLAPRSFCPLCYELVRTKFYNSVSVVYFVFTLYKSTGDTIYFACGGITGTIIAVLNVWLMVGFFPGGYRGEVEGEWVFWVGAAWGSIFVALMLYLNFDGNTKVFGLTTYVWYWMAFLNHTTPTGFTSQGFKVRLNGRMMSELSCAVSGCGLAIIATFFPYPLLATWRMDDTGKALIRKLHNTWSEFIEYYSSDQKNPYAQNILAKELAGLQALAGGLSPLITSSWYECFGLGKWQEKRMMMKVLDSYLTECFNRLSCVLSACLSEDFEGNHGDIMRETKDKMSDVIDKVGDLLSLCEDNIMNCGWNRSGRAEADTMIEELDKAVDALTRAFLKKVKEMEIYQVSDDVAGENLVASNLCCWARITANFAKDLQAEMPEETGSWKDGVGLCGAFAPDIINDPGNLNYVMRGWISVMVAFYVGFNGVAGKMIKPFNPALASTICVLLTKSLGGALGNNLKRLQGVVLGTVIGQVAYALLAWCVWWGYISVAAFVWVWSLVGLYMYYHSDNYSTVGLLLVVFANSSLLQGCSDEVFDPTIAYYGIINTVSGITIMGIFDMLLAPDRASNMARVAFKKTIEPLRVMTQDLFDPLKTQIPPRKGAIRGMIARCQTLNNEAYLEPRYWRGAWPVDMYAANCSALTHLRFNLATVDYCLVENTGDPRAKCAHFVACTAMEEFVLLRKLLLEEFDFISASMEKVLSNEIVVDVFDDDNKPDEELQSTQREDDMVKALEAWAEKVSKNQEVLSKGDTQGTLVSMEDDAIADMCILYGCLQNVIQAMKEGHEALAGA